jgi:hypothetical protein
LAGTAGLVRSAGVPLKPPIDTKYPRLPSSLIDMPCTFEPFTPVVHHEIICGLDGSDVSTA